MPKPNQDGVQTLSGNEEILFVSESAPTDGSETDPENYTVAGLPQETPFSSEREEIRGSNKLQTFSGVQLGSGQFSIALTCERPVQQDAGQAMIRANHLADPAPPLYFLLVTYSDQDEIVETIHGMCKVPTYDRGSSTDSVATFDATLAGHLAPTFNRPNDTAA